MRHVDGSLLLLEQGCSGGVLPGTSGSSGGVGACRRPRRAHSVRWGQRMHAAVAPKVVGCGCLCCCSVFCGLPPDWCVDGSAILPPAARALVLAQVLYLPVAKQAHLVPAEGSGTRYERAFGQDLCRRDANSPARAWIEVLVGVVQLLNAQRASLLRTVRGEVELEVGPEHNRKTGWHTLTSG